MNNDDKNVVTDRLDYHQLSNGMVLLGEPMEGVESVAFGFMLPAGAAMLPEGCCGAASVIGDWIFRGAGGMTSRQLSDALDGLGLHRMVSVGTAFITMGAALEASNLSSALDLYASIINTPHLETDQFVPARQLVQDEILGLDDDPRQKVSLSLREQFYPTPWGRSTLGHLDEVAALTADQTRELVTNGLDPCRSIFAVAGKYDFAEVCQRMETHFGALEPKSPPIVEPGTKAESYRHLENEGAQVHIGLMTEAVTPGHKDYYLARVAVSILSGGMSSRLFTEVREKRGLCYAIGARYHGLKEFAGITCYAGTTPDKAQETVDVIVDQFHGLHENLTEDELARAKVGLKSALIMQSESSSSRSGAIGSDYYTLGRVRRLDEIKEHIDAVTVEEIVSFLQDRPFTEFTTVTIGPASIQLQT